MVSKCEHCKVKKIGLTSTFSCRCNLKNLCMTCRFPENHNCSFDFIKDGRDRLQKDNPKIEMIKVEKI